LSFVARVTAGLVFLKGLNVKKSLSSLLTLALCLAVVSLGVFVTPSDAHAAAASFALDPGASMLGFAAIGSIEQLRKLTARRTGLVADMTALTNAAAASADGNLTDEQRSQFDALNAQVTGLDGDITRVKATMEAARGVDLPDGSVIHGVVDNTRDAPNHGFRSFGEFAVACVGASGHGAQADPRLQYEAASTAPGSYGNVGNGADGGYLVPPEFSTSIVETAYNENQSFVPMTDSTPVSGNNMTFPVDESTPWGSTGIKAYWTDEGGAATESKAQFAPAQLRLKKLTALMPLTEEMLADGSALGAYVQRKAPEAVAWKTNEALWGGNGVARPKGFYASTGLLVSVAKETSQAADTIVAQNISKMRARMSSRSWRRAIWMINNDALPQLDSLMYATAATNGVIYKPEGGRFGYGTLLGRDVMVTDFNETVGDKGDIVLADWGMYRTITKAGGVETTTSMHFWFDRGITAFRLAFRIDGQPSITAPVTPNKGSNTLSPIVTLDART
jgi:HK97 family phage major capsid protein